MRKRWPLAGRHVLITGASEGIGRAVAIEAARRGARLTLCARGVDRLDQTLDDLRAMGAPAMATAVDVTCATACVSLISAATSALGPLDLVVANAGIGSAALAAGEAHPETLRRFLETNVLGVANVVAPALPMLIERGGMIVGVSSLQGLVAFPRAAAYTASKHALRGYLDSLRLDLKGRVHILVAYPGPVATRIFTKDARPDKTVLPTTLAHHTMTPERCAGLICDAIESARRELIMTAAGRFAFRLNPFLPALVGMLIDRSARRFYR